MRQKLNEIVQKANTDQRSAFKMAIDHMTLIDAKFSLKEETRDRGCVFFKRRISFELQSERKKEKIQNT